MAKKKLAPPPEPLYSVHPSVAYTQAIVSNMPVKTGRSLDEWVKLVKQAKLDQEKQVTAWLKEKHQLGGTTATLIAHVAVGKSTDDMTEEGYLALAPKYVEAMYAGPKAALRPLHDALLQLGRSLGPDVKVCPCQTIVPLYRNHVFAEIKPTTRTRIDLGLALKDASQKLPDLLIDTGGLAKKNRITHRIPLSAVAEIDDEVKHWLRVAYDLDK
jgi:hypothetical protein